MNNSEIEKLSSDRQEKPSHFVFTSYGFRDQAKALLTRAAPYMLLVLLTAIALNFMYAIRSASLSVPMQPFGADGVLSVGVVKALGEGTLLHDNQIGAPFGLDYQDVYQPDLIHHWILKGLMIVLRDPILSVNIFFITGFLLIALTAFYVMRQLGISTMPAIFAAELYAFLPSHLARSYYHLFLSEYFLLPLVVLIALKIMGVGHDGLTKEDTPKIMTKTTRWATLFFLGCLLAAAVGIGGVYYAFYSALFLAVASLFAFCERRWQYAVVGFTFTAVLCLSTVMGMLPIFRYRAEHGLNKAVVHRTVAESEIYGLQIADLYLPAINHPVEKLRALNAKYGAEFPVLNENEGRYSGLGIWGALGFTTLLLWPWLARATPKNDRLMWSLSLLNLAAVLFATVGGIGTLFSFLITPEIRANTRMVFFIAFFSLSALAVVLDKLRRKFSRKPLFEEFLGACLILALLVGLYDEGVSQVRADVLAYRTPSGVNPDFKSDSDFVKRIENGYPAAANVLQLPYQSFPESIGPYKMNSYDLMRAYIHSTKLRWSYPSMRGRPTDDWIRNLSLEPVAQLVQDAVASGFLGLYIDREGYPDSAAALEAEVREQTGLQPQVSENKKLSFFNLSPYASKLGITSRPQAHMLLFGDGVYLQEGKSPDDWHWCQRVGMFQILNNRSAEYKVTITGSLTTGYPEISSVSFRMATQTCSPPASIRSNPFSCDFTLKPGLNQINFMTDAKRVLAPSDVREMYFRVNHFRLTSK